MAHAVSENCSGLNMAVAMNAANGNAETRAGIAMTDRFQQQYGLHPATMGSDKRYDDGSLYLALEERGIIPHGAMTSIKPKPETAKTSERSPKNAETAGHDRLRTVSTLP
ncbi:MAG: hypothetical protein WBH50_16215 [Fuerstiella sp.]